MNQEPGSSPGFLATGCVFLFCLIFFLAAAGMAVSVGWEVVSAVSAGKPNPVPAYALVLMAVVVSVFGVVGIFTMVSAWKSPAAERAQRLREKRHPGQPWLWREDWEQGFAWAQMRGDSRFRMTAMPGVLGGRLQGRLETTASLPFAGSVEFVLSCVSRTVPIGGRSSGSSEVLWQEKTTAAVSPGAAGAVAAADFEIPFDARATWRRDSASNTEIFWLLSAQSTSDRFHATFTVPVFQTVESDPSRTRERLEAEAGSRLAGFSPAPERLEKIPAPEGIHYRFPRRRNRGVAVSCGITGLLFLAIALLIFHWIPSTESSAGLAIALFPGAIGILALVGGVWKWFGETTVTASPHEVCIHSSGLLMSRTRVFQASQIQGLEIKPGMQGGRKVWYDVRLKLAGGNTAAAGADMDKTEAEWLVAEIRKNLGVV
jgi:hypothetical protein